MKTYDSNVEATVIVTCLFDCDCLDVAIENITSDYFMDLEAREIFQKMKELRSSNKIITHESIEFSLKDSSSFEACMRWIAERNYFGSVPMFPESLRELKEFYRARKIQEIGKICVNHPTEKNLDDLASLLNPMMDGVYAIEEHTLKTIFDEEWYGSDNFPEYNLENYERHKKGEEPKRGLPFGYPELDISTRGMKEGYYVTIGGRPGAGKTTFALNVMLNNLKLGKSVGFISLEMNRKEAFQKLLSAMSGVPYNTIEDASYYSREIFDHVNACAVELRNYNLFIEDGSVGNLSGVLSRIRKMKRVHGIDLVCIDYIGLMGTSSKNQTTVDRLSEISKSIRSLLKELQIPGLVLAQVNRDASKNESPLKKENIKDCDQIVADSYIVILLDQKPDQKNQYHEDRILGKGSKKIVLRIDKTRFGPTKSIDYVFNGSTFREEDTMDFLQKERLSSENLIINSTPHAFDVPLVSRRDIE